MLQLVEKDTFDLDLERLDRILVQSIFPQCFLCGNYFLINEVCVRLKVPNQLTLRFHRNNSSQGGESCWGYFVEGVAIFVENESKLKIKNLILS